MIKVRVPATSANIGPGFDCLGLAVNLYNYFSFEIEGDTLEFEGCNPEYMNENNLIYQSYKYACERLGFDIPKGLRIVIDNNIPISRGLGSSATCIVGGIMGAAYTNDYPISKFQLLELATEIEGHPDNVAPAIYGGFTISIMDDEKIHYTSINTSDDLRFCALVPDFMLSTKESRGVLPSNISYGDGIHNIGRVAMLIGALANGDHDLLSVACEDKLHQPYRGPLVNDYETVISICKNCGTKAVFLSGAGPTIMNIITKKDANFSTKIHEKLNILDDEWSIYELEVDRLGAVVI